MKLNLKLLTLALFSCMFISQLQAQDIFGKWEVTNDKGKINSIIEIYENGDEVVGEVVRIMKEEDRGRRCEKCEGALKNRPIEGLRVIHGFEKDGDEYTGGTLIDPDSGKEYKGKIWLDENDPDKLKVRGYLAFFFKTKTWNRVE